MKKKLLFTMVLFVAMVFLTGEVFAYNPNCLPGGDNYLDPENFILSGDQYVTKDPFLVKPYTDYILSFPCEYERVLPTIKIEMYENDNYMDELEFNERTFSYNSEYQVTYISFKTLSNTNYLGVLLYDGGYITENGIEVFMLEEGTEYDGYEPYIDGTIADTDAPYFQGAGMIVSYVDTPITVAEIQSALTAYDAVDGDVTASIVVVNDAYSANSSVLGAYTVTFAVSDSSGNQNEVDVTVNVVDVMEPVFGELAEVIAVYPNAYTAEDIRAMLTASDNYDGDISSSITITNDNYTANNQIVGSYQMDFSVTDSSGNGATHSLVVKVVDQEAPVVTGTANITIGYDSPISVESVRSGLSVIDNYDQSDDLSLILSSDNYTANSETIGTYSMVFEVYDSSNNRTEKAITLTVIDNVAPAVYFDSSVIQVYSDSVLTLVDITYLLRETEELDKAIDYDAYVIYDSYSRHAEIPGVYHLTLQYISNNGTILNKNLQINVVDRVPDYHQEASLPEIDDPSFFSEYMWYIIGGGIALIGAAGTLTGIVVVKKRKAI